MKIMFLDESGDHNFEKIDKLYPVFVLAGVIFDYQYYLKTTKPAVSKFKDFKIVKKSQELRVWKLQI